MKHEKPDAKADSVKSNGAGNALAPTARETRASKKRRTLWIVLGAVAVAAAAPWLVYEFLFYRSHESTDDAFIDAHVSDISARVEGQVTRVLVDDNQRVARGDILVEIDPPDYEVKLDQARARLLSSKAVALKTGLDLARYEELLRRDEVSRQQVDASRADADSALADVRLQEAAVRQAELNLSYTRVTAPDSGRVTHKSVETGDYVKVGEPLLAVVPSRVYVTANFKETQLTRMKVGQSATIKVDVYPGRVFKGHVDSIQAGTGAQFSLLPPENATGNYVKVVERIPVKIDIDVADAKAPLSPGMSVEPTIDIK